ncbi:hypothetical protein KQI49_04550 [Virgibacillus sp. MSJ-26]|uniref:permease prefix domain 1-containing protein n=1 Tax=Virgibacillus sp. MSJ-26 TaxID=2841522 RepID=UPI001C1223A7|nr:permease prefix domain 1-containing protein [Virgibacillus sp. MSJ-26]MBU5466100.1 hypothetical protein [Virgibacillus sp. MSJ-26]
MNKVNKYVNQALEQIQSPTEEREDIREELLSHIYEAKKHFMTEGFSEKKAEDKALEDFGKANNIGKDLQEAMYPFQRSFLYIIGIAMIVYGVLFYLNATFNLQEIIPSWLAIQFAFGGAVTLCAINISFVGRHFYVLHLVMFLTLMWNGFNFMVVEPLPAYGNNVFFWIYLAITILIGIIFIFTNSYYSTDIPKHKAKNGKTAIIISYFLNLILGMMLITFSLFLTWVILIFGGFTWPLVIPLIPVVVWLIFYKLQMRLIAKKPIISIFTGLLVAVLPLGVIYLLFSL